jgi:diacylglycerol kinase family enzyme
LGAMRTHPFLLINPRSGGGSPNAEELAAAARERGIEAHLLEPGEDPRALALLSRAEIVGVAGGDGSLAAVASAALELDAGFVCVPFGTRNHFARDVGLDHRDPLAALAAFAAGGERRIDLGRVGDRLFLNNVSIGAYAGLVHRRERHRRRGEALARAKALLVVARRRHRVHLRVDGEELVARVLLIGNNRYELDAFTLGARSHLDAGELELRTAAGWWPRSWERRSAPRFRIELPGTRVAAAIDGEPVLLEPPLELESLHRALRLLVPDRMDRKTRGGAMHDNPRATEDEQELAQQEGRQREEESMRYPEHHDADEQSNRARSEPDEDR